MVNKLILIMTIKYCSKIQNSFDQYFYISNDNNLTLFIQNQETISNSFIESSIYIIDQTIKWIPPVAIVGLICFLTYSWYNQKPYGSDPDSNNTQQNNEINDQGMATDIINVNNNTTFRNRHFEVVDVFDTTNDPVIEEDTEPTIIEELMDRESLFHQQYIELMNVEYEEILRQENISRTVVDMIDPDCLEIVLNQVILDYPYFAPIFYYRLIRTILILRARTSNSYYENLRTHTEYSERDDIDISDLF